MTRVMNKLALALGLGLGAALLLGAAPAPAQEQTGAAPTVKLSEPTKTNTRGQLVLGASLRSPDGKPLTDRQVEFYLQTSVFGPRDAHLGTATTDSTGMAMLVYEPATRGQQSIKARFAGAKDVPGAEATATIEVRESVEPFHEEALPLASVRQWLPFALTGVVVAVWSVVLGALVTTAFAFRSIVRATIPGQHPAPARRNGSALRLWRRRPVQEL